MPLEIFSNSKKLILDTLFPINCLSCQKSNYWLCDDCWKKIATLSSQVCPYCEKNISTSGKICSYCRSQLIARNQPDFLDALIVATHYSKNNLARLIHIYKYNFITELASPLAKIMVTALLKNHLPLPDLIIPIPLHPRRLRWRGFNQAELLAKELKNTLLPGFPLILRNDLIIRKKYTSPQMKIKNYAQRKQNIKNIFFVPSKKNNPLQNKTILLVDDICTTGSTIMESAKILKQAGAKKVFGIVIARQEQ